MSSEDFIHEKYETKLKNLGAKYQRLMDDLMHEKKEKELKIRDCYQKELNNYRKTRSQDSDHNNNNENNNNSNNGASASLHNNNLVGSGSDGKGMMLIPPSMESIKCENIDNVNQSSSNEESLSMDVAGSIDIDIPIITPKLELVATDDTNDDSYTIAMSSMTTLRSVGRQDNNSECNLSNDSNNNNNNNDGEDDNVGMISIIKCGNIDDINININQSSGNEEIDMESIINAPNLESIADDDTNDKDYSIAGNNNNNNNNNDDTDNGECNLRNEHNETNGYKEENKKMKEKIKREIITLSNDNINEKYQCNYCNKICNFKYDMETHIARMHINEKPFKCNQCNKSFTLLTFLNVHKNIHTNKYKCNICNKGFKFGFPLKEHKLIHTNEKPFECHYCDKKFNRKSSMRKHERLHNGIKPFKCHMCDKSYIQSSSLKHHLDSKHYAIKKYKCNKCEKSYCAASSLRSHKNVHTTKFQCKICKKNHPCNSALHAHLRSH